jgi:hypothetical protein
MKLKGLTKLALSGVALAAVAATLGTSTYAWYVTNSSATVDGIQGAAKAGGLGNVLVAENSSTATSGHGDFVQELTLSSVNITTTTTGANGLIPAHPIVGYDSTAITTSATAATAAEIGAGTDVTWVDEKGKAIESGKTAFIEFDVWVLSTDATTVKFTYAIDNVTDSANLANQIAYAGTGLPTGVSEGDTFNVNILDALRMNVYQTNVTSGDVADGSLVRNIYDVAAAATTTANTSGNTYTSGGTANTYYTAVLGDSSDIIKTELTGVTTKTTDITVKKNTPTKLNFKIWLEGTDNQCFDSCSGQEFEIVFTFDTSKSA